MQSFATTASFSDSISCEHRVRSLSRLGMANRSVVHPFRLLEKHVLNRHVSWYHAANSYTLYVISRGRLVAFADVRKCSYRFYVEEECTYDSECEVNHSCSTLGARRVQDLIQSISLPPTTNNIGPASKRCSIIDEHTLDLYI